MTRSESNLEHCCRLERDEEGRVKVEGSPPIHKSILNPSLSPSPLFPSFPIPFDYVPKIEERSVNSKIARLDMK